MNVFLGIRIFSHVGCLFQDLMKCLRLCTRLEHVQPKRQKEKEKVAEYIRTHVACIELCVTSWQSQATSGSQNARERVLSLEKVTASRDYTWLTFILWSSPNARDKIHGADVIGSINHVIFLINRFSRLVSLPTSAIFVLGTRESVSHFLEFSRITTISEM